MLCSSASHIEPGLYQHYKGPLYRVLGTSKHSETEEELVLYQALYGQKGYWSRPLSMFTEQVTTADGQQLARFARSDYQSIVLEVAELPVKTTQSDAFLNAFAQARPLIERQPGFIAIELKPNAAGAEGFLLLVVWQRLEDHTDGFRRSSDYQKWSTLLHPFYDPFPKVNYYSYV